MVRVGEAQRVGFPNVAHLRKVAPVRRMPEVAIPERVEVRRRVGAMTEMDHKRVVTIAVGRRRVAITEVGHQGATSKTVADHPEVIAKTVGLLENRILVGAMVHGNPTMCLGWTPICRSRQIGGWGVARLFLKVALSPFLCGVGFQEKPALSKCFATDKTKIGPDGCAPKSHMKHEESHLATNTTDVVVVR